MVRGFHYNLREEKEITQPHLFKAPTNGKNWFAGQERQLLHGGSKWLLTFLRSGVVFGGGNQYSTNLGVYFQNNLIPGAL